MMQPRLGTSSTVSTDCLLSHAIRSAVNSELNTSTLRTPLRRGFGHGPHQRGLPRRPSTSVRSTYFVLRRCMLLTRDAYDRFLPSTASISSTRASFVLRRDRVSRLRTLSVSACAASPGGVASRRTSDRAPSVFTTPKWLHLIDAVGVCFSLERQGVLIPGVRHRPQW
jgi:hypothetical protein